MNAHLDCKLTPAPDMVVLREVGVAERSAGGFYLAEDSMGNGRMGHFKVEAIGESAEKASGVKVGNYVFADRLASYYHTTPVCVMHWKNILLFTDSGKHQISALPGWVLMKPLDDSTEGFILEEESKLRRGKIISIGNKESKFKQEDVVMLSSHCDLYEGFSEGRLFAAKEEEIIARFDDEQHD